MPYLFGSGNDFKIPAIMCNALPYISLSCLLCSLLSSSLDLSNSQSCLHLETCWQLGGNNTVSSLVTFYGLATSIALQLLVLKVCISSNARLMHSFSTYVLVIFLDCLIFAICWFQPTFVWQHSLCYGATKTAKDDVWSSSIVCNSYLCWMCCFGSNLRSLGL